jgi:glycosyltransferase involved in cell wall biosynthesis
MRVLSISTDRKLFHEGSSVFLRSMEYVSKLKEMHVIVFSLKTQGFKDFSKENLFVYPTNSTSKLMYMVDAIRIGKKIVTREGFSPNNTVITCQDPFETGLVGYLLNYKFHLPLQLQVHTDFLSSYFKKGLLNRFRVFLAKFIIPSSDGIRVVSSVIADSIKEYFPKLKAKVSILPIFVDVENIINREVGFDKNIVPNILMLSRLSKEKRILDGIEAFKVLVLDNKVDARLTIVGLGPEKENIISKINELGLKDSVQMVGWEDDAILRFKKADIYLLTSEYEGYGMTLIEAGASGCVVVTTKVGIAKTDIFKDGYNSYVCEVGDVNAMAVKLKDLITNSDKRKLFKQRLQDSIRASSVTRDEYVEEYVGLLRSLIHK